VNFSCCKIDLGRTTGFQLQHLTRMRAYAQRGDRRPNIGGALCWVLLRKSRKCRSGAIWGRKELRAVLSNYKVDVYETWRYG